MASAMCEVVEHSNTPNARTTLRRELKKLRADLKTMVKPDPRLRNSYRRSTRAMAARARGWLPWWQRSWPGEIGWFEAILLAIGFIAMLGLIFWEP